MAIVFAVRGDSLDARYSNNGKSPGAGGNAVTVRSVVNTNVAGINGTTSIDMTGNGAGANFRPLTYPGDTNTPAVAARSALIRFQPLSLAVALPLFHVGGERVIQTLGFAARVEVTGEIRVATSNEVGQTDNATSTGAGVAPGAFYDVGISWDGTVGATGLKITVNSTVRLSTAALRALPTFDANIRRCVNAIVLGVDMIATSRLTNIYVDEFVLWDEVVDFTSNLQLESGAGALSGALRTSYVAVDALDGAAASGGASATKLGGQGFNI